MVKLIPLLLIKAFLISLIILYGEIGLNEEEAQYWCWSQALDVGYYSKPPGIAWQIYLGTKLFSDTEFGVRFFSLVLSFCQSIAIYLLAKEVKLTEKGAFFAAVGFAVSPLGMAGSLFATTDVGMTFFWTIALIFYVRNEFRSCGLAIACGALFKWPIYLLLLPLIFKRELVAILLSFLGLIPSLLWNLSHHFVTFKHVQATILNDGKANPLDFASSQVLLFSPLFFLMLLCSYKFWRKEVIFIGVLTCSLFLVYIASSFYHKIQGNWLAFAYPGAFILIGCYGEVFVKRYYISLVCCGLLSCLLLTLPALQSRGFLSKIPDPYAHNKGWRALKEIEGNADFLFSDKYQTSSVLSFYGPLKKRAHYLNLNRLRWNQFDFWEGLDKEIGKTGIFVHIGTLDHILTKNKQLEYYFKNVRFLGSKPLNQNKSILLYQCEEFLGFLPANSTNY